MFVFALLIAEQRTGKKPEPIPAYMACNYPQSRVFFKVALYGNDTNIFDGEHDDRPTGTLLKETDWFIKDEGRFTRLNFMGRSWEYDHSRDEIHILNHAMNI